MSSPSAIPSNYNNSSAASASSAASFNSQQFPSATAANNPTLANSTNNPSSSSIPSLLTSSQHSNSIYSLYIINKAGGLIYQKDFNSTIQKLNSNDYLRLASTFHSLHAIAEKGIQIKPLYNNNQNNNNNNDNNNSLSSSSSSSSSGINSLLTNDFRLQCYQTMTGLKFLIIAEPNKTNFIQLNGILIKIYLLYCDYVLKNPFYEVEMPIRIELFDNKLLSLIQSVV